MATAKLLNWLRPIGSFGWRTAHIGGEDIIYTAPRNAIGTVWASGGSVKITDNAFNIINEYSLGGSPVRVHVPHGGDRVILKGVVGDAAYSFVEFDFPTSGDI